MTDVHGSCDEAFRPVEEELRDVLAADRAGSALAVWLDGRMVVDLWGGSALHPDRSAWTHDTLVMPYSVSKPLSAVCALLLVERGLLRLDVPARTYWPEVAWDATVEQVLDHTAGLVLLDEPAPTEAFLDWDDLCSRLARQAPSWTPGTALGESAFFYGHLVGELVRRVDGRSLGTFLREEVCAPHDLDLHVGLRAGDLDRVADLVAGESFPGRGGGPLRERAIANPPGAYDTAFCNSAAWRRAEVPAVNAHVTARAVAQFYALVAGGRVLRPDTVAEMAAVHASGPDLVVGADMRWGLGVSVEPDGWGMGGSGGNLGWWSEEGGYALGFVTAHLGTHDRSERLENAVRSVLGLAPL